MLQWIFLWMATLGKYVLMGVFEGACGILNIEAGEFLHLIQHPIFNSNKSDTSGKPTSKG